LQPSPAAAWAAAREPAGRSTALPLHTALRSMSAGQAAWAEAARAGIELTLSGSLRVQMRAAPPPQATALGPRLHVGVAGHTMALQLAAHPQWQELALPVFERLAAPLQLAIRVHLTQELRLCLCAALHRAGLLADPHQATVCEAESSSVPEGSAAVLPQTLQLALRVQKQQQEHDWLAWLHVPAGVEVPAGAPVRDAPTTWRPRLPLSVVVGHARIASRALLASLAPGQVLLLDRVDPRGGLFSAWLALVGHPVGCVSFGTWQPPAIGETAADAVTARRAAVPMSFSGWLDAGPSPIHHPAGPRAPRSESMTSLTSDAESANGGEFGSLEAALDEATVRVEAVIELPAMRVTDLHRWTAGTLLRSAATVDGAYVLLRVAGRSVGRGRLVAIDSLLGLELVELFD
jgi:flagellar motor switch/type III secretory pathway protein FliN